MERNQEINSRIGLLTWWRRARSSQALVAQVLQVNHGATTELMFWVHHGWFF